MNKLLKILFVFLSCSMIGQENKSLVAKESNDYIIECPKRFKQELIDLIDYTRQEWKDVKNPLVAYYKGNDIGDYFHLIFEDDNEVEFDFGNGNNNFGNYILYNRKELTDNPKYLNKKFKVFWKWKESSFYCCSGEYKSVKAYMPSIYKLEFVNE